VSDRQLRPKVVPDSTYPNMYRVRWPDGRLSDMVNLTRANDAVAAFLETEERRKRRGRQSPAGASLVRPGEKSDPRAP
jgi:hypothetical protein